MFTMTCSMWGPLENKSIPVLPAKKATIGLSIHHLPAAITCLVLVVVEFYWKPELFLYLIIAQRNFQDSIQNDEWRGYLTFLAPPFPTTMRANVGRKEYISILPLLK